MDRTACTEPQYLYSTATPLLPLLAVRLYRTSVPVQYSYTSTPPMDRTACTEPQCLYKDALYFYLYFFLPKPYARVGIQTPFLMFDRSVNDSECTMCTAQYFCLVKSTRYPPPPCTPLIKSLPECFQLTRCRSEQPFSPTSKLNRPIMQLAPASTAR